LPRTSSSEGGMHQRGYKAGFSPKCRWTKNKLWVLKKNIYPKNG